MRPPSDSGLGAGSQVTEQHTVITSSADAGQAVDTFQLRGLSVSLRREGRDHRILESLNFNVREGECLAIVGPSGTGKTTLLRALAGLIPHEGSLTYRDQELEGPAAGVALVFQDYVNALLRWRNVRKNVALGVEGKLPKPEREERVAESLRTVGLAAHASSYPWQLSGGMQQRVQIARALAMGPKVLLFDEPFGALDAMTRENLQDELLRLLAEQRRTCVFITHDIDEAVYIGDRVLVLAGSPATISFEAPVPLGRERNQLSTKEAPEFLELRHQVYKELRRAHGHA